MNQKIPKWQTEWRVESLLHFKATGQESDLSQVSKNEEKELIQTWIPNMLESAGLKLVEKVAP